CRPCLRGQPVSRRVVARALDERVPPGDGRQRGLLLAGAGRRRDPRALPWRGAAAQQAREPGEPHADRLHRRSGKSVRAPAGTGDSRGGPMNRWWRRRISLITVMTVLLTPAQSYAFIGLLEKMSGPGKFFPAFQVSLDRTVCLVRGSDGRQRLV